MNFVLLSYHMKRQSLLSALLLLVLLDEVGFIRIFMSFNHISDNAHGEAGRTLTREAILLLRAAAPNLDQRSRYHIMLLGCARRRGCRAGRAKTKHQHSLGIPTVVGRRPNRLPATSTSKQSSTYASRRHNTRVCSSSVLSVEC